MLQLSCRQTKAVCVKLHRINHCQPQYILHLAPGCAGLTKMWAQNVLWEGFSCKTHICCDFLAHCYFLLSGLGNIDPDPDVNNKGHLNASEFLASTWLVTGAALLSVKGLSARLRRRSLLMPIAATFFSRALLMEWECSCCIGWCWQWEIRGGGVLQNSALHLLLLSVRTFMIF